LIHINSRSIAIPVFDVAAAAGQRTHIKVFTWRRVGRSASAPPAKSTLEIYFG
jgi:hypothetical protein